MKPESIDTFVLGASGYVAGELFRLLRGHPVFRVAAMVSASSAGRPVAHVFPHLEGQRVAAGPFVTLEEALALVDRKGPLALFSCAAHGSSAAPIERILEAALAAGRIVRAVDLAADFRLGSAETFAAVYGREHGAPDLMDAFECLLPELARGRPERHVAHPGCFTTAVVLGVAPFLSAGVVEDQVQVCAVTGSSGSGSRPSAGTHHPERHGNMWAYRVLNHRHRHEMARLLGGLSGRAVSMAFTPVSGPFARGIHAVAHLRLRERVPAEDLARLADEFYAQAPFVTVSEVPPRLKDVVGTNRCRIGVAAEGRQLTVCSVIDNLTKGAAGGALQWMNKLFDLPETSGLELVAPAWS